MFFYEILGVNQVIVNHSLIVNFSFFGFIGISASHRILVFFLKCRNFLVQFFHFIDVCLENILSG